MIAPTARAIAIAASGAPLCLVLAAVAAPLWPLGAVWALALVAAIAVDAWLAPANARVSAEVPAAAGVGAGPITARLTLDFGDRGSAKIVEIALETNARLQSRQHGAPSPIAPGRFTVDFTLDLRRRGLGKLTRAFARWRGPLGLAWREQIFELGRHIVITPDLKGVEREARKLFSRSALLGVKPLQDRGDGSEFDALREFQPGMDRRLLDWKQSARHMKLLAKEVTIERNHQIVFAIDAGRTMCEPIYGAPRIDWSLNAALLLAYVSLKLGDRVSLLGFDAGVRVATGFLSGAGAMATLQAHAARLDYSIEETNFTLSMTSLTELLRRRSMIVIFTDFADATSAELMFENVVRLNQRHVVVFVTFRDEELEELRARAPFNAQDVARAVIADNLLRERDLVLARLRRIGVEVVSANPTRLGPLLVRAYDEIRRRERL